MRAKFAALIALTLLSGCTWTALRQESVELSGAGADIRYREAIENLAMVSANRWALPAYTSIYAGSMNVTDTVQVDGSTTWVHSITAPSGFASQTADMIDTRSVLGTQQLDPMIAPEKIRALRAACQWAVFGGGNVYPDRTILDKYQPQLPPGNYFGVDEELAIACSYPWLGKGCRRRDVPKNACYSAHCGKCYVWVCPEGMEGFSRFLLVCQKIARFDLGKLWLPVVLTKQVKWASGDINNPRIQQVSLYVDDYGNLAMGQSLLALPPKQRNDNTGQQADLKASLNSVITLP
jgi:hypothetical protein